LKEKYGRGVIEREDGETIAGPRRTGRERNRQTRIRVKKKVKSLPQLRKKIRESALFNIEGRQSETSKE